MIVEQMQISSLGTETMEFGGVQKKKIFQKLLSKATSKISQPGLKASDATLDFQS